MKKNLTKIFIILQLVCAIAFTVTMLVGDEDWWTLGIDFWALALVFEALNRRRFYDKRKELSQREKSCVVLVEAMMSIVTFFVLYEFKFIAFWLLMVLMMAEIIMIGWQNLRIGTNCRKDEFDGNAIVDRTASKKAVKRFIGWKAMRVFKFGILFIMVLNIVLNFKVLEIMGIIGIYVIAALMIIVGVWQTVRFNIKK